MRDIIIPHMVLYIPNVPTRKDSVQEFVIKALYCRAVV